MTKKIIKANPRTRFLVYGLLFVATFSFGAYFVISFHPKMMHFLQKRQHQQLFQYFYRLISISSLLCLLLGGYFFYVCYRIKRENIFPYKGMIVLSDTEELHEGKTWKPFLSSLVIGVLLWLIAVGFPIVVFYIEKMVIRN